jgi:hypothetical protein
VQWLVAAAATVTAAGVLWRWTPVRWFRMKVGRPLWADSVRSALRPELDAIEERMAEMHADQGVMHADQAVVKTALLVALGILGDLSDVVHRELNHNGGSSMKDQAVQAAQQLAPDDVSDEPTTREAIEAAAHKLRQQAEEDILGVEGKLGRRHTDPESRRP